MHFCFNAIIRRLSVTTASYVKTIFVPGDNRNAIYGKLPL